MSGIPKENPVAHPLDVQFHVRDQDRGLRPITKERDPILPVLHRKIVVINLSRPPRGLDLDLLSPGAVLKIGWILT